MQTRNRKFFLRGTALMALIITLSIASSRIHADTGSCGGASVTIPFTDVPSSNVFFCAIAEAYFSGLTNGTSATTYSPGANVPREQMAAFVTRTLDQSLKRGSGRAELGKWWHDDSRLYSAGLMPSGIKSDGQDLWVANNGDGTVHRVRSSDGRILETWSGAVAGFQVLVARGYVFITGYEVGGVAPNRIYRIDPSLPPGSVTTITNLLPNIPRDITTDGRRLWVAMDGGVSIVSVDGTILGTFSAGFTSPGGILFDGSYIWVTDTGDNTLKKLDVDGTILQSVTVGTFPLRPVFDGTNIWVPNANSSTVTLVRASTGAVIATLSGNNLAGPLEAAFDGERILITNVVGPNSTPSMWRATDLSPIEIPDTTPGTQYSVCSDGVNFWMTKPNQNQLWRY